MSSRRLRASLRKRGIKINIAQRGDRALPCLSSRRKAPHGQSARKCSLKMYDWISESEAESIIDNCK